MIVYQVGRFYWHPISLVPGSPHIVHATTNEQTAPFRIGRSLALRFWKSRGLVVGMWQGKHEDEESALMAGMHARPDSITDESGGLAERFQKQAARRTVAAASQNLDEEWTVINALDLME